ncbi:uncharacterized protein LOC111629360 [Centruroides sculpturatus]|uniref:uncharacterized protein LOC111629360 n=1 Tax=Centruroides sculpturatus TaxID=218467 RepID=UPI000C6E3847|nr:uncharacterized protein LOC111629360 [Centruroides sculpturatus]
MYATCFLLYAALFVNMKMILKISFAIIALVFLSGLILVSWSLSFFTTLMYDSFINIEKISSVAFPLEFKFKMDDFMKRFGKNPIGISIGGFFYIKRNFVIRVISGLYSILSSLVQISGVLERENKCLVQYRNSTRSST